MAGDTGDRVIRYRVPKDPVQIDSYSGALVSARMHINACRCDGRGRETFMPSEAKELNSREESRINVSPVDLVGTAPKLLIRRAFVRRKLFPG